MQYDRAELLPLLQKLHPENNGRYSWSDLGNGYLMADVFHKALRFCPERNQWFYYDGKRWTLDIASVHAMEAAKELGESLISYSNQIGNVEISKAYTKFTECWRRHHKRETILREAQSVYPVSVSDFDCKPELFNCQNGTLNLNTREFRKHNPEDLLTQIAGTAYVPEAECGRWLQFMREITCEDKTLEVFLQKSLGYALSGYTDRECFFLLYGATSRNGKGTLMETIMKMMGDYGKTAIPQTITQQMESRSGGPTEDIARLAGARFVNISEPDKKMKLNSSLIKRMTGRDTIAARYLNENTFEYVPQYTIFINTNHLPSVNDDTVFTSGRCHVIPFHRHFLPQEQDIHLKEQFAQALPAVFNYCLEGYWLLQETGFDAPESVRDATRDYREDNDKMARFVNEMLAKDSESDVRTADVYTAYKEWCQINGYQAGSIVTFKADLKRLVPVVENKRPREGGSPTTLIEGYRLEYQNIG